MNTKFSTFQQRFVEKYIQMDLNVKTAYKGDVETVIKGVNKRIIDIKCTNNEYFDRALLFVNRSRDLFSEVPIDAAAEDLISELTEDISDDKVNRNILCNSYLKIVLAVFSGMLVSALMFAAYLICK
ncbi:hypothetical protein [Ruminococcus sp.]|uniref:hypothetical protein n=1 Tax=Ruminococcus sp. TaxID=41978 RepID=UPI0025EB1203|nr:hypothetical protein [Ruminococcus sp.]MBQ8965395.1 hypothetical protein [Ruminococcus sp.]